MFVGSISVLCNAYEFTHLNMSSTRDSLSIRDCVFRFSIVQLIYISIWELLRCIVHFRGLFVRQAINEHKKKKPESNVPTLLQRASACQVASQLLCLSSSFTAVFNLFCCCPLKDHDWTIVTLLSIQGSINVPCLFSAPVSPL